MVLPGLLNPSIGYNAGMKFPLILASDFSGIGLFILIALAVAFTVGGAAIVLSATVGRRRWWGLLLPGLLIGVGLYAAKLHVNRLRFADLPDSCRARIAARIHFVDFVELAAAIAALARREIRDAPDGVGAGRGNTMVL